MLYFFQQVLNGIHAGSFYAVLAFGYVLINRMLERTNLAYGAAFAFAGHLVVMGTVLAWDRLWLVLGLSFALAALMSFAVSAWIGDVLARRVLWPLRTRAPNAVVVATLGVAIVLGESARISVGGKELWLPPMLNQTVTFMQAHGFRVTLTVNQLVGIALAIILILAASALIYGTRFGRNWQAASDDRLAAELCGVHVAQTFRLAVALGTFLAAASGITAASYYGNISFSMGLIYGLKVLIVTAAGSYASPLLAAAGAASFGIGEALWTAYFPSDWRDGWMLGLLVVMLVLRAPAHQ